MKKKTRIIMASTIFIAVTILYNFMVDPFNKRLVAAILLVIIYVLFMNEINYYLKHFFGEVKKDVFKGGN